MISKLRKHIGYRIFAAVVLVMVTGTLLLSTYFVEQHRRSLLAQHRDTLGTVAQATIQGMRAIMLTGNAEIARSYADNQKGVTGLGDMRILRVDGSEAFYDNKTTINVNQRRGSEEFSLRDEEKVVTVVSREDVVFRQAIESKAMSYLYTEEVPGEKMLTMFAPILNDKGCFRCHGSSQAVRGVIKISAPMHQVEADIRRTWLMALIALPLSAIGIGFIAFMIRRLTLPIQKVAEELQKIGDGRGDLSVRLQVNGKDELAQLAKGFNTFVSKIESTLHEVSASSHLISQASTEIAAGNQDLNLRTEQTALSLQQTAGNMDHLTLTVNQTADAARQANQMATSAAAVAARGGVVVNEVVDTMNDINSSSKKIAEIIDVINGIAFQTNILALNAAVEAARAGEQGRGFAVVAGEVRSLASRSAQAAREINTLISASVQKVQLGAELVQEAGKTMNEIVGSVNRVSDTISEITAASNEQSQGISQVNASITELDAMTQQNAALVHQSAAAAESLSAQAHRMEQAVQVFRG